MYHFGHLDKSQIEQLVEYNKKMYPSRAKTAKERIDFWLSRCENAYSDIIVVEKDNELYGQVFFSKMFVYNKGEREDSFWNFDLIVDEKLRKEERGLDLMQYYIKEYPEYYCTGSGPLAYRINLALGVKMLGEIRKYVGIVNPLWFVTAVFRGKVDVCKYPERVGKKWKRINSTAELHRLEQPYNADLFEIGRDGDFMNWRFFSGYHPYAVYVDDSTGDYFVVTTTVQKHITALVLVDFRCSLATKDGFEEIAKATRKIANKIYVPIVICGSSHTVIDAVLEEQNYKSIGRPRPIMGKKKFKDVKESIKDRSFAFVTLADSDGETSW